MEIKYRKFRRIGPILFVSFLLVGIMLQSTPLPTRFSYAITIGVYIILFYSFIFTTNLKITSNRSFLILFFIFVLIVSARTLFDPRTGDLIRLVALLVFTASNLFILPVVISFHTLLTVTSRVGAIVVLIGYLPFLGFPVDIWVFELSVWRQSIIHPDIPVITSIFIKPNHLGFVALVGAISAIYEWEHSGSALAKGLLSVHLIGLFMTDYRAAWLALTASLAIFFVYIEIGRLAGAFVTLIGLAILPIFTAMLAGFLYKPALLADFGSLSGRKELWITNIMMIKRNILFGVNFTGVPINPHNSYIRMFVAFGALGGLNYSILSIKPTIGSARQAVSIPGIILTMFLVSFIIIQMFNQLSFVGISLRSTLIAVMMGYYITGQYSR